MKYHHAKDVPTLSQGSKNAQGVYRYSMNVLCTSGQISSSLARYIESIILCPLDSTSPLRSSACYIFPWHITLAQPRTHRAFCFSTSSMNLTSV